MGNLQDQTKILFKAEMVTSLRHIMTAKKKILFKASVNQLSMRNISLLSRCLYTGFL